MKIESSKLLWLPDSGSKPLVDNKVLDFYVRDYLLMRKRPRWRRAKQSRSDGAVYAAVIKALI